MATVFLVHGGLWESGMDARRFWHAPGVVNALGECGFEVVAPDRVNRARSWDEEADHLAAALPAQPVTVLGGSNGVSAAARLALTRPDHVERLILAWPATAGDPAVDARIRDGLTSQGATPETVEELLDGETVRGMADAALAEFSRPVGLLPAVPENPFHQHRTVDRLADLLPNSTRLPGTTEPPRPGFAADLERFIHAVRVFAGH